MNSKLVRVDRYLNIYRNSDDDYEEEILMDIPFDQLTSIVIPKVDDPLLYDGYILSPEQLSKIQFLIEKNIIVDFEKYFYVLECVGIYD